MGTDDEEIFADLYNRYYGIVQNSLYRLCRNWELAGDLTQETFLKIFNSLESFDPRKGNFSTWSMTIGRNVFLNHQKKNEARERRERKDFYSQPLPDNVKIHSDVIEGEMIREEIGSLIEDLPEPESSIIRYRYEENKTLKEIATITGLSISSVNRKLLKALEIMRGELEKKEIGLPDDAR